MGWRPLLCVGFGLIKSNVSCVISTVKINHFVGSALVSAQATGYDNAHTNEGIAFFLSLSIRFDQMDRVQCEWTTRNAFVYCARSNLQQSAASFYRWAQVSQSLGVKCLTNIRNEKNRPTDTHTHAVLTCINNWTVLVSLLFRCPVSGCTAVFIPPAQFIPRMSTRNYAEQCPMPQHTRGEVCVAARPV